MLPLEGTIDRHHNSRNGERQAPIVRRARLPVRFGSNRPTCPSPRLPQVNRNLERALCRQRGTGDRIRKLSVRCALRVITGSERRIGFPSTRITPRKIIAVREQRRMLFVSGHSCRSEELSRAFKSSCSMTLWIGLSVPQLIHTLPDSSGMYGGDDGARTRDLCRDRAAL